MTESNKMKEMPVKKLMVQMGIPMILSMALQAVQYVPIFLFRIISSTKCSGSVYMLIFFFLSDHALCVAPVLIYPGTTRKRATYHHSSG